MCCGDVGPSTLGRCWTPTRLGQVVGGRLSPAVARFLGKLFLGRFEVDENVTRAPEALIGGQGVTIVTTVAQLHFLPVFNLCFFHETLARSRAFDADSLAAPLALFALFQILRSTHAITINATAAASRQV